MENYCTTLYSSRFDAKYLKWLIMDAYTLYALARQIIYMQREHSFRTNLRKLE